MDAEKNGDKENRGTKNLSDLKKHAKRTQKQKRLSEQRLKAFKIKWSHMGLLQLRSTMLSINFSPVETKKPRCREVFVVPHGLEPWTP